MCTCARANVHIISARAHVHIISARAHVHIISARALAHFYVHYQSAHVHLESAHVHFGSAHVHFLCSKCSSTSAEKAGPMYKKSGIFNSKSVPEKERQVYRTMTKKAYRTSIPYF